MVSKKQILNVIIALAGFALMQRGFSDAQGRAILEQPFGQPLAIGVAGFVISGVAITRFIYERHKTSNNDPAEILSKSTLANPNYQSAKSERVINQEPTVTTKEK